MGLTGNTNTTTTKNNTISNGSFVFVSSLLRPTNKTYLNYFNLLSQEFLTLSLYYGPIFWNFSIKIVYKHVAESQMKRRFDVGAKIGAILGEDECLFFCWQAKYEPKSMLFRTRNGIQRRQDGAVVWNTQTPFDHGDRRFPRITSTPESRGAFHSFHPPRWSLSYFVKIWANKKRGAELNETPMLWLSS